MKVEYFRLSGYDFRGEIAERMFAAIQDHGFGRVGADLNPWPMRANDGKFVCYVDVSGVSAHAELRFDDADSLLSFLRSARILQHTEEDSTAAYRKLLAINDEFFRATPEQETTT